MYLIIERAALMAGLTPIINVVENRNTIQILHNVMLHTNGDSLSFTGTDLDIEISTLATAEIQTPGLITVPARLLGDIARRSEPGADICIAYDKAKDPRATVKVGRSSYVLPVLPAEDFPIMSNVVNGVSFEVLPSDLARLIDKTRHAVSTEETRYYLNGGFLHVVSEDGNAFLRIAATDGRRAATADIPAPEGSEDVKSGLIVPRKTLASIRGLLDASKAPAEITMGEAKLSIAVGDTHLVSKVIDGSFPDYARVIPRGDGNIVAKIKGNALSKGIERATIMAEDKARSLRCKFSSGALNLSSRSETGGRSEVELDIEQPDTGTIEIGVNAKYLDDVAGLVGEGDMIIHLRGESDAIRIDDATDPNVTYVVMPIRV